MKFIECKDVEIVNCDFEGLKNQKKEIENKNKKIIKHNKLMKTGEFIWIVLISIIMLALTSAAMLVVWQSLEFNMTGPFFSQFEIEPRYVKYIIEVVILLLGISLFRIFLSVITFNFNKRIKSTELLSEQIHFAMVVEHNTIGNLRYTRIPANIPYVSQYISFSFDAVNPSETEYYPFSSESSKWRAVHIPGIFKTIIDAGSLLVFLPYYDENATVKTLEDAYVYERRQRTELERQLANMSFSNNAKEEEVNRRLALAESQNKLMEKEMVRQNELVESERAEKRKYQAMYRDEQARSISQNFEEEKKAEAVRNEMAILQKQCDDAIESQKAIEEKYNKLNVEFAAQTEQLRIALAAKESKENEMETLRNEYKDKLQQIQDECNTKIQTNVVACNTKIQEISVECENRLRELTEAHEEMIHNKDLGYEQMEADYKEELSDKQFSFEEQIRIATEEHAAELEAQRVVHERSLNDIREQLDEEKKNAKTLSEEKEKNRVLIERLEHNAKSVQIYHENLENEIHALKANNDSLSEQIKEYQKQEEAWNSGKEIIEQQKRAIKNLEEREALQSNQKEVLNKQLREVEEKAKTRDAEFEKMKEEVSRLEAISKKSASLEQSNNDLRNRNRKLMEEKAIAENAVAEKDKTIEEKDRALEGKEKEIEALTTSFNESKNANDRLTADLLDLQKKLTSSNDYVSSLEYNLKQASEEIEKTKKGARTESPAEADRRREAEGAEFAALMKKREEQIRKAREDAMAGRIENN